MSMCLRQIYLCKDGKVSHGELVESDTARRKHDLVYIRQIQDETYLCVANLWIPLSRRLMEA